MWEADPSWRRLPGASGPSTVGVWLAQVDGRSWVVKRLSAPDGTNPALADPAHAGYWRREAEVAREPDALGAVGLVPPEFGPVEEDDEGVTVWSGEETGGSPPGLFVARALGRFAAAPYDAPPWAARRLLEDRLAMAAERGGWPTLARTTLADVTDRLWARRHHWLALCADGPQGRVHGDAVPTNFVAARGEDVVAVDWQCFGTGPVGADLGYFALSSREELDVLLETFLDGAGAGVDPGAATLAARVTAVYSVVSRAEWALAQVAGGEGALAGKYRHPAVSPHLRALQRQFPQIETLL
jgi:hypothetical protein